MFWTPERDALLHQHYRRMHSQDIADMLGCTARAVRQRAYRLGLTVPKKGREPRKAVAPIKLPVRTVIKPVRGKFAALVEAWR